MWRLLLGFGLSITAFAQGQVNFNNKVAASGINARIFMGPNANPATSPPFAAGLVLDTGGEGLPIYQGALQASGPGLQRDTFNHWLLRFLGTIF